MIAKYKKLQEKRTKLLDDKRRIEAELNARKRALKDALDACRSAGFNPDTLAEDIKKLKEVLYVKLNVFEADLAAAEEKMKPLLAEIDG
jgi:chaperonin cofactor prefoldin